MSAGRTLTIPEIRARRRNGRLGRGRKTRAGRLRSSLNRREWPLPSFSLGVLKRLGSEPRDFYPVWRDVLAVFNFMGPELQPSLVCLAWDWWLKLRYAERGESDFDLKSINVRLEKNLGDLMVLYQMTNREWHYRLQNEFWIPGEVSAERLRWAAESRMSSYRSMPRPVSANAQLDEIVKECLRELELLGI